MSLLFYIIFGGFILVSISWCWRILRSWQWIENARKKESKNTAKEKSIYLIIPVLDETRRIKDTVDYLIDQFDDFKNMRFVLVTTEKEFTYLQKKNKEIITKSQKINNVIGLRHFINNRLGINQGVGGQSIKEIRDWLKNFLFNAKNTIDISREIAQRNNNVVTFHYPDSAGKMADQLNFAVNSLIREGIDDDSIFCVYNADSRPDKKTFEWVLGHEEERKIKVFQQYGNYLKNLQDFHGPVRSSILTSAALWQTRWSIGFEIFNALKQVKYQDVPVKKINYPLNYCIGHGLFFTKEIYIKLGGFNGTMHNEDAIFGLELSYLQELIMPIPYFDESDSPDAVSGLYLQKANWFLALCKHLSTFLY